MGDHGAGFFPGWPGANGRALPEVADIPLPAPARPGSHPVPTGPPDEGAPEEDPGEEDPGEAKLGQEAPGVVIATLGAVPTVPGTPPVVPPAPTDGPVGCAEGCPVGGVSVVAWMSAPSRLPTVP